MVSVCLYVCYICYKIVWSFVNGGYFDGLCLIFCLLCNIIVWSFVNGG